MRQIGRMGVVAIALLAAPLVSGSARAAEMPKPATTIVEKASAPVDHQLRFGKKKQRNQSFPQTAWLCFTPGGSCNVPFLGPCCCTFWNGFGWVQLCGST